MYLGYFAAKPRGIHKLGYWIYFAQCMYYTMCKEYYEIKFDKLDNIKAKRFAMAPNNALMVMHQF